MEITPKIFTARVMHKRLFPKVNTFEYGIYYLFLPLSSLTQKLAPRLAYNKFGFASFYDKDHGYKDGKPLREWADEILKQHRLNILVDDIILVSMPRIMGYVFNPVSFWLCLDKQGGLRAVIYEVNNTFGETHSYLCAHDDGRIIHSDDWLEADKVFHVSPFLKREGHYQFRFLYQSEKLAIWINFFDAEGNKQLLTSLVGTLSPLTKKNMYNTILKHPLVTMKAISLIHWQALKLIAKGIKYIPKPKQLVKKITKNRN